MSKWLTRTWWRYLLDDSRADKDYGTWLSRAWCRLEHHRCGVWFCNVGGTEPDYRCKGCGEDLG